MRLEKFLVISGLLVTQSAFSHGPEPMPLQKVPIPHVHGTIQTKNTQGDWIDAASVNFLPDDGADPIVVNKEKAIALGKALFWDMAVGSDGMACGSCHFHAGADSRTKNQLNPGLKSISASGTGQTFEALPSGAVGGPNHTLTQSDFPTFRFADPFSDPDIFTNNVKTFSTDDVVSSSGTFSGNFTSVSKFTGTNDECVRAVDAQFHVGGVGTRRVEPRNAPTVINSVFNYRNFWDGRANNVYNGSSPWGDRDADAGVWVKTGARSVAKQRLHLLNSSLASLAMGPPLNDAEMSCRQRNWPNIGRKLLLRQPLQNQKVHHQDSVFAPLGLTSSTASEQKSGLNTTYKNLIVQAFNPKFWAFSGVGQFGAPAGQTPYNQMEANFSMFFGIALQLYQSTLVSDQAPIDLTYRDFTPGIGNQPPTMRPTWVFPPETGIVKTPAEINSLSNGESIFVGAHCNVCHAGPLLTTAAVEANSVLVTPIDGATYGPDYAPIPYGSNALAGYGGAAVSGIGPMKNVVNRDNTTDSRKLMDMGFMNTGVNDPLADPGINANDDFGNPLSFSAQYVQYLLGNYAQIKDKDVLTNVRTCDFTMPFAHSTLTQPDTFRNADGLQADGAREGISKNTNCLNSPLTAFIPTTTAAANALLTPAGSRKMARAELAAFKIPSLRNVELTGPYMHNGSMATLDQVVAFYTRHGNVRYPENLNHQSLITAMELGNLDPYYTPLPEEEEVYAQNRADLIAFLKTFTDDRVRYEKAPFDHPEVIVPHGHSGDSTSVTAGNPLYSNFATEQTLTVPAVGAGGSSTPIQPFDAYLAP